MHGNYEGNWQESRSSSTPPGDWEVVEEALDVLHAGGTLRSGGSQAHAEGFAALARLREREAQNKQLVGEWQWQHAQERTRAEAAEARVKELEDALRKLRQWDMLNGYIGGDGERHEPTADAPYWRDFIDRALAHEEEKPLVYLDRKDIPLGDLAHEEEA